MVIDTDHDAAVFDAQRGGQRAAVRIGGGQPAIAQRTSECHSCAGLPWLQVARDSKHERERAAPSARAGADIEALLQPERTVGPPLRDARMSVVDTVAAHSRPHGHGAVKSTRTAIAGQRQTRSHPTRRHRDTSGREPGREMLRRVTHLSTDYLIAGVMATELG